MTEYVHVPLKPVRVVRVTYKRGGKLKPRTIRCEAES